ncbi:MAG: hypothetical protein JOS17DRAFT_808775 [Linnemannia elongata]|nr:MAG: hypothetical protein JOS17DRAFT_808775 [Linnemannia elongata]
MFPNAHHIKRGNAMVTFVRNAQQEFCSPYRIKQYPGVVLEVVDVDPSDVTGDSRHYYSIGDLVRPTVVATTSPTSHRLLQRTQSMLQESSAQLVLFERSVQAGEITQADAIMHGMQEIHQDLCGGILALHSEVNRNKELLQRILDMQTEADILARRMEEMQKHSIELQGQSIRMQQEALDRLALLQNKVAAIFTQTYELHEYPIPRLFIVLPKESTSRTETLGRGIKNLFADQFTLYFLCECGEHTKPVDGQPTNPSLKHEIHIARHEGYEIDRPNEFFDKYGLYILALLQMLKYGVTIAGVVVPPLGQLNIVDVMEGTHCGINTVLQDLGSKVDSSIAYIESLTGAQSQLVASDSSSSSAGLGGLEALEGADLRHLESFLKTSDKGRVLGNLYRIVTSDGHVKWVCLDHYRENYRAKAAQDLRDAIQGVAGRYDESTGRASVDLSSPTAARIFYAALASSRSVQSLEVRFEWSLSLQDLRDLRDAIKSTNVIEVTIKKLASGSPLSDVFNNRRRSDPLLQMLSGGNLQSYRLFGWDEGFLDCIGTIPTTLTVRKFQEKNPSSSILQANPVLSCLWLTAADIDSYADHILPALERAKLPRAFKVVIGYGHYSRALFKVEAHTGRVQSIDVRCHEDFRTKFLYHPSVRHIHFLNSGELTPLLDSLHQCLRNNTGLESVNVDCSSDDIIEWLQGIHSVFIDYPQQPTQLHFSESKLTMSASNIQDLSTTAIYLDRLSNNHLSASYLSAVKTTGNSLSTCWYWQPAQHQEISQSWRSSFERDQIGFHFWLCL